MVGWIAWPFAAYTDRAVEFFNRLPHGVIVLGEFSFLFVVLFYAILLTLTFAGPRLKQALRPALAPSVIIAALGISVFLVWSAVFHVPDGRLHLTFLNVGSADAILIQTPDGRVHPGGRRAQPSGLCQRPRTAPLRLSTASLDWLVVASPQEQQVAALPTVLDRFPAENVLWAGNLDASYSAGELDRWLAAKETPVTLRLRRRRAGPGARVPGWRCAACRRAGRCCWWNGRASGRCCRWA